MRRAGFPPPIYPANSGFLRVNARDIPVRSEHATGLTLGGRLRLISERFHSRASYFVLELRS